MNQYRVVFDTNVYISGLVYHGVPAQLLDLAINNRFVLCFSDAIRHEVADTLELKFLWPAEDIAAACKPLWEMAEHTTGSTCLNIITADPDDDRILECAVDGQAEIIVTGDGHLLSLNRFPQQPPIDRIRIMTPRQFFDELMTVPE
jgi:uncharacterized protein